MIPPHRRSLWNSCLRLHFAMELLVPAVNPRTQEDLLIFAPIVPSISTPPFFARAFVQHSPQGSSLLVVVEVLEQAVSGRDQVWISSEKVSICHGLIVPLSTIEADGVQARAEWVSPQRGWQSSHNPQSHKDHQTRMCIHSSGVQHHRRQINQAMTCKPLQARYSIEAMFSTRRLFTVFSDPPVIRLTDRGEIRQMLRALFLLMSPIKCNHHRELKPFQVGQRKSAATNSNEHLRTTLHP